MFQEFVGGAECHRATRRPAATFDPDPASFHQDINRPFRHGNTAHSFNLGTRHRLPIGNNRQGFELGLGQLLLLMALFDKQIPEIICGLEPPMSGHLDQIDAALRIRGFQRHQNCGHIDALR